MNDQLNFWFAIDTLEYLRRGGRIGAVASMVGGAIKIKPILTVNTEGIVPVEKVRTEVDWQDHDLLVYLDRSGFIPSQQLCFEQALV